MSAAVNGVKKISVYDYPEHLNPFHEDDNHNKIRFWTLNKSFRRGSLNLSSFKDLRNTWTLKSFMKKGKKEREDINQNTSLPSKPTYGEDSSPVQYRRALQYSTRATVQGTPERYVYGGSITPLPRSRFQQRMRSASQMEVNESEHGGYRSGLSTRSETNGSRQSIESTNPFDEATPVRATRRKKKRAPLPPSVNGGVPKSLTTNDISSTTIKEHETLPKDDDVALDDPKLSIILQIVEDDDQKVDDAISSLDKKETTAKENESMDVTIDSEYKDKNEDLKIKETSKAETNAESRVSHDIVKTEGRNNDMVVAEVIVKNVERNDTNGDVQIIRLKDNADDVNKTDIEGRQPHIKKETTKNSYANGDIQIIRLRDDYDDKPKSNDNEKSKYNIGDDSNNNEIVFKKVNISQYRRNSSCNGEVNRPEKEKSVTFSNKRSVSMTNNFSAFDVQLYIDEDVDCNDNQTSQPQKVICKVYDSEPSRKKSINASISSVEREFMEIDKTTKELEMEIDKLNSSINNSEKTVKTNGSTVSAIRKLFDRSNGDSNSLNPVPKPRRTKIASSLRLRK